MHATAIPILPLRAEGPGVAASAAEAAAGCGGCLHGSGGAVCRTAVGEPCAAPELSGPVDDLRRVLRALASALGFPAEHPEHGGVRALHLAPGEAELQLAYASGCGGAAAQAEAAFEVLRRLLPDTDIYVRPAR